MLLLTLVYAVVFFRDLSGMARDAVAMMTVLASAIHLFASLTMSAFLFVFFRSH